MKNIIDENSEFREGDEIYNPKKDEYFKIVTSYYKKGYNEIMVFLLSSNTHPEENVYSHRLSHLIKYGYYIIS
jgi:hypothetical protein